MKNESKNRRSRVRAQNIIWWFVFISLAASIVYIITEIVLAPSIGAQEHYTRIKGDYVLMLAQCILGVAAMFLPSMLHKRVHLVMPSNMIIAYTLFLYCAIFLGEVRNFYYEVPHWDTILHTFSGTMLGALGFSVINVLNNTKKIPLNLSPVFVAVFTFCFGLSLGVIWEFYEFACDGILNTNMQKFALESGEMLVGRAALTDTMKDLIVDAIGAAVMAVIGYISLKFKKGWVEKLLLHIKKDANQ